MANLSEIRGKLARYRWTALAGLLAITGSGVLTFVNHGWLGTPGDKSPPEVKSSYLVNGSHNKFAAVVFVHGIFGTKNDTWLNPEHRDTFPGLLATDPRFKDKVDVFAFEYFTPKFGAAPSIVDLADQLRGELNDHHVFDDHQKVVFLAHSMGGLVVRQFVLDNQDRIAKIPMISFYATPTNGSEMAAVAHLVSVNPQLRGMVPIEGNDLLQAIQSEWLSSDKAKSIASYCGVEELPTRGIKIVTRSSATSLCNRALDPFSANHIDIVKPADHDDSRYTRFVSALSKEVLIVEATALGSSRAPAPSPPPKPKNSNEKANPTDGLIYVWIPPGAFSMGCSLGDQDCDQSEKPPHDVHITKGFWLGQTEVTVKAYSKFVSASPDRKMPPTTDYFEHSVQEPWSNDRLPITNVTWQEALNFCREWTGGDLPTEAQWEYGARGNINDSRYGPIDDIAWYANDSSVLQAGVYVRRLHEPGVRTPNRFGLYDMLGNAWEWVADWYSDDYYALSPKDDPPGPPSTGLRTYRGGSSDNDAKAIRASKRQGLDPNRRIYIFGFRCLWKHAPPEADR